jgi:TRAP-type C4-dicarboxylate transport system substrate-binding protein
MTPVRMRFLGALAVSVMLTGCVTGGGKPVVGQGDTRADQNPLVLTIATGEGAPIEAQGFADAVAEASHGSIEVRVDNKVINGHGVPDYETKVIQYVARGDAALGFVAARAFDTVGVEAFDPLHAPFLINSYALEAQVLSSPSVQALLDNTRSAGVIGLGYVQGPLRRPLAYTHPLLDLGDYQGARIGIRESGLIEQTMAALGATPDVFSPGLTAGLDGMEVHVAQIDLGKYDIGADSLTGNVVFWPRPGVIFANPAAFEALTTDQQAILREAGRTNLQASDAVVRAWEAGGLAQVCRRGLRIEMASDAALEHLRVAATAVYDEIEADPGAKAIITTIDAIRASLGTPSDRVECTVPAATPLPSQTLIDSPIVGTWKTSFSKEEFQTSPMIYDAGERNDDGNWGDFTLIFAPGGQVSLAGENAVASSSTSGTYAIDADRVVLMLDEGANRGETFAGRWSVFRDTLTFERIPPDILPTTYLVRAWTRVR